MFSISGSICRFRWCALSLIMLCQLTTPVSAAAQEETVTRQAQETGESINEKQEAAEEEEGRSLLDAHKEYVDTRVQRASQWVDSFFNDPNYDAEAADSQIRIRPEFYYRDKQGASGRFRMRLRLNLPNLGRRVSLVAGADEEDDDISESGDDDRSDGLVGLQFFLKESSRWNVSFTAGVKFNDAAFLFGPRVRFQDSIGERGSYRFTQTLRWQTNNYWQINSRLDLNRIVSERYFFRQTFDGRWRGERSDEEGYRTLIGSYFTQRLGPQSGLQYEFSTIFHTRPDTHVDKYTLALRYRRQTSRPWLYYEIIPQISFEDEFGYELNPGIRLRVEIFYGGKKLQDRWNRALEDTENFRW